MPWTGPEFRSRHNHGLTPHQSAHAASVANAILRRTGDEGLAIATANARERAVGGLVPHYDIGGVTPSAGTMNPNVQGIIQQFSSMPIEKLQEAAARLGGSPYGALAQRVLHQRQLMPTQGPMPPAPNLQPSQGAPQISPPTPQSSPPGYAFGGTLGMSEMEPWWTRQESRGADAGFLHSAVPGRTDHIPASPAADSFVIPADVVSGLGEGNSLAGAHALQLALGMGPHGVPLPPAHRGSGPPRPPRPYMESRGGKTETVKIMAAGGELIVPPEVVAKVGGGNVNRGHKILEHFVIHARKKVIKEMQHLKGPVKS